MNSLQITITIVISVTFLIFDSVSTKHPDTAELVKRSNNQQGDPKRSQPGSQQNPPPHETRNKVNDTRRVHKPVIHQHVNEGHNNYVGQSYQHYGPITHIGYGQIYYPVRTTRKHSPRQLTTEIPIDSSPILGYWNCKGTTKITNYIFTANGNIGIGYKIKENRTKRIVTGSWYLSKNKTQFNGILSGVLDLTVVKDRVTGTLRMNTRLRSTAVANINADFLGTIDKYGLVKGRIGDSFIVILENETHFGSFTGNVDFVDLSMISNSFSTSTDPTKESEINWSEATPIFSGNGTNLGETFSGIGSVENNNNNESVGETASKPVLIVSTTKEPKTNFSTKVMKSTTSSVRPVTPKPIFLAPITTVSPIIPRLGTFTFRGILPNSNVILTGNGILGKDHYSCSSDSFTLREVSGSWKLFGNNINIIDIFVGYMSLNTYSNGKADGTLRIDGSYNLESNSHLSTNNAKIMARANYPYIRGEFDGNFEVYTGGVGKLVEGNITGSFHLSDGCAFQTDFGKLMKNETLDNTFEN